MLHPTEIRIDSALVRPGIYWNLIIRQRENASVRRSDHWFEAHSALANDWLLKSTLPHWDAILIILIFKADNTGGSETLTWQSKQLRDCCISCEKMWLNTSSMIYSHRVPVAYVEWDILTKNLPGSYAICSADCPCLPRHLHQCTPQCTPQCMHIDCTLLAPIAKPIRPKYDFGCACFPSNAIIQ